MTDHMGPVSVEWMESHMGPTVGELGQDMANGYYGHGHSGMYGPGGGC